MIQKNKKKQLYIKYVIKFIHVFIIFLMANFVFLGCGMKDTISFSAATLTADSPGGWAHIQHNTANTNKAFKGYDVYYKFYATEDTSTISSDKSYITDSTRIPSRSTLTTKKFRLIRRFNQNSEELVATQTPNIKPDSKKLTESYTVYIDFSAAGTYSPLRTSKDASIIKNSEYISKNGEYYKVLFITYNQNKVQKIEYLKRNTGSKTTKNFFEYLNSGYRYSKTDDDIKDMIGKDFERSKNAKLSIVFAVIPYGIDFGQAQVSYGSIVVSDALELDYRKTP